MHATLTKAIQQLIEHPERDRIHKLLYWVCNGQWENSTPKLNQMPIEQLLPELVQNASTFEKLETRLHNAASGLNKKNTYTRMAMLIASSCADFYAEDETIGSTQIILSNEPIPPVPIRSNIPRAQDRFELRRLLMQQSPPAKIKILLFSVLRHPFSFNSRDWAQLKAQTLDAWIAELLQTFPAPDVLEKELVTQAAALKTLDQSLQIADIIVQSIRLKVH